MIELACAAEGSYVPHSAAMIHSVISHAGAAGVRVHYLHSPRLEVKDQERLEAMVSGAGSLISFHQVSDDAVRGLPDDPLFTAAMWHRILLPQLVPDVEKILYLDIDTIVLDDLAPLWATDISGHALGAVTNVFQDNHRRRPSLIGLPEEVAYFNSGVLLMNLVWMRDHGTTEHLRRIATERAGQLKWPDQDALNLELGDRRLPLHPRWNSMNALHTLRESRRAFTWRQRRTARMAPGIRHFEGPGANKPWHADCQLPFREAYFEHRWATPWPEVTLVRES